MDACYCVLIEFYWFFFFVLFCFSLKAQIWISFCKFHWKKHKHNLQQLRKLVTYWLSSICKRRIKQEDDTLAGYLYPSLKHTVYVKRFGVDGASGSVNALPVVTLLLSCFLFPSAEKGLWETVLLLLACFQKKDTEEWFLFNMKKQLCTSSLSLVIESSCDI